MERANGPKGETGKRKATDVGKTKTENQNNAMKQQGKKQTEQPTAASGAVNIAVVEAAG